MRSGTQNREVVFERRAVSRDPVYGTTVEGAWTPVATVMAEVQDLLPSRAEGVEDGIVQRRGPCRVRLYYREDLNSSMRLRVKGRGPDEADRLLKITGGPAELGYRRRIEFTAEELSTSGQEP